MLIINADDFGGCNNATDRILHCCKLGRVTSVSAMVFMDDSPRAAELGKNAGIDTGLHINFTQRFECTVASRIRDCQDLIIRFLLMSRYASVLCNPGLRDAFRRVYDAQCAEFVRLYGREPSHFDGHHHMHLCTNMLLDFVIPKGMKVRRSFSFWPGEKSVPNRLYRTLVDRLLSRRYRSTEYLFALSTCLCRGGIDRVVRLASISNVELQTHPEQANEFVWLTEDSTFKVLDHVVKGAYADL